MARPCSKRRVALALSSVYFAPRGIPVCSVEVLTLALDEAEALRLADYEGKYHEEAAARMRVSRATFGRILETARRKVADAIAHGKALRIEGGNVEMTQGATAPLRAAAGRTPPACSDGTDIPACCPYLRDGSTALQGAAQRRRAAMCPLRERQLPVEARPTRRGAAADRGGVVLDSPITHHRTKEKDS